MKYCRDCANYRPVDDQCRRPRPVYECPVRGPITPTAMTDCYYERSQPAPEACGLDAAYYTARVA